MGALLIGSFNGKHVNKTDPRLKSMNILFTAAALISLARGLEREPDLSKMKPGVRYRQAPSRHF